jgi:NAD(P)-dependent dehydrogenase (short-subunit alcohol dehydrogenase family)
MIGVENNINNSGRVAVITGSSKGIGKAIAVEFAKAGYSVVLNARTEEELKRSADDISKSINDSSRVISIPGDVSQEFLCFFGGKRCQTVWKNRCYG